MAKRNYPHKTYNELDYELHGVKVDGKPAGFVPVPVIDGTNITALCACLDWITQKTSIDSTMLAGCLSYGLSVSLQTAARDMYASKEPTLAEIDAALKTLQFAKPDIYNEVAAKGFANLRTIGVELAKAARKDESQLDPNRIYEELL